MKTTLCMGLALLAGAVLAQDRGRDDGDRGGRDGDRGRYHNRDRGRSDGHWDRGRHRGWRDHEWRDHDRYYGEPVYVAPPIAYGDSVFDLQCEIGNLSIELTNLRRGPWFDDRDRRCHELDLRIRTDRDRINWLRRH